VVNPELMAWHNSGEVLLMVILGGLGHLRGAVIGAIAFTLLKEIFSTHAVMGPLADHWQLTLGLAIIVFVALLPKGLIGLVKRLSPKETA
jgi:branched-chain amino acid transport system permease protein